MSSAMSTPPAPHEREPHSPPPRAPSLNRTELLSTPTSPPVLLTPTAAADTAPPAHATAAPLDRADVPSTPLTLQSGGRQAAAEATANESTWSASLRQRLFDRVFTPDASPWMSFSSALGWAADDPWNDSDEYEDDDAEGERRLHYNEQDSDAQGRRDTNRAGMVGSSPASAAPVLLGDDERTSLLHGYSAPSPSANAAVPHHSNNNNNNAKYGDYASSAETPARTAQRRRRRWWHQRLRRHIGRHAGWFLFLLVLVSLELAAALVMLGGVAMLRTSYADGLLRLHPWGVASCVCGAGVALLSLLIVLCLRKRCVLGAVGALVLLLLFLAALVVLTVCSLWLVWVAWDGDSKRSLSFVYSAWEAAARETRRRAAAGESTRSSPICQFQAAHHCSGFRYGCCDPVECFDGSSLLRPLLRRSVVDASSAADTVVRMSVPEWAEAVCPVCQEAGNSSHSSNADGGSGSDSAGDSVANSPVMCTMSSMPSMLRTTVPYACVNLLAIFLVAAAVVGTRKLHRAVKRRRSASVASRSQSRDR